MKGLLKRFSAYTLLLFILFPVLLAPSRGEAASAAEDPPRSIEETNALDDLEGSILNGKKFDIAEWGFNERRSPEIVSFVEFGYSFYSGRRDDYGLYIYIYNPRGTAFDADPDRDKIELKAGDTEINRYPLRFLNYSDRPGTEGMFYKFKVGLDETQRSEILNALRQDERHYRITQVDLSVKGVLQSISCAATYKYSGYAQGYGSELMKESTLVCITDGFEDYAELEVHQTVYRPQGDFYAGEQAQLNSCYFRVPETYYENYGILTKIICDWYEYVTKPILVTQIGDLYQFLYNTQGGDIPAAGQGKGYAAYFIQAQNTALWGDIKAYAGGLITNAEELDNRYSIGFLGKAGYMELYDGGKGCVAMNHNSGGWSPAQKLEDYSFDPANPYSAIFYTNDYKTFSVTANEVEKAFRSLSEKTGGAKLGAFSESLFTEDIHSDRQRGYNHMEIAPDDPRMLFTNYTVKNFWQDFLGTYTLNTVFETVNAIHEVTADDLAGADEAISERLYVGVGDVADLKAEYAKAKAAGERLILLRYADSHYYAIPFFAAGILNTSNMDVSDVDDELIDEILWKLYEDENYDGFIAQQTVYLDFKIISLNYTKNGVETVIPVVMTPQNVFSPVDPPLEIDFHAPGIPWYVWLILAIVILVAIIVLVRLFPVLRPILNAILKALVWILLLPVRAVSWLVKKISDAVRERKKHKAEKAKRETSGKKGKKAELTDKPPAGNKAKPAKKAKHKPAKKKKTAKKTAPANAPKNPLTNTAKKRKTRKSK